MGTYIVSGKVLVEVTHRIEAKSKEDALKKMNEQLLYINTMQYDNVDADEPIKWDYAEEYENFYGKNN